MNPDPAPEPRPKVNYVFVDLENVPGIDLSFIEEKTVQLMLLLGPHNTKLPVGQVERLMAHPASTKLVRLEESASEALDLTLAYYLGRAVLADPNACFHIVSNDKGFDPLVKHLNSLNIDLKRHVDVSTLPFGPQSKTNKASQAPAKPAIESNEIMKAALEHLSKRGDTKPRTRTRLRNDLRDKFGKAMSEKEVETLIQQLKKSGHISINDKGTVTYHLKQQGVTQKRCLSKAA
jgi:hypothetical protein